jgi:hypothetical protein
VQCIHDHWRVDISANLDHLALIPTSEPYIDDVEFIPCVVGQ